MNNKRRSQPQWTHPPTPAPQNRATERTHGLSGDEDFDSTGDNYCAIEPLSIFLHTRLYKAIHKKHPHITLWDEYNGSPENHH